MYSEVLKPNLKSALSKTNRTLKIKASAWNQISVHVSFINFRECYFLFKSTPAPKRLATFRCRQNLRNHLSSAAYRSSLLHVWSINANTIYSPRIIKSSCLHLFNIYTHLSDTTIEAFYGYFTKNYLLYIKKGNLFIFKRVKRYVSLKYILIIRLHNTKKNRSFQNMYHRGSCVLK